MLTQVGSKCPFGEGEIKLFCADIAHLADYVSTRIRSGKKKAAVAAATETPALQGRNPDSQTSAAKSTRKVQFNGLIKQAKKLLYRKIK